MSEQRSAYDYKGRRRDQAKALVSGCTEAVEHYRTETGDPRVVVASTANYIAHQSEAMRQTETLDVAIKLVEIIREALICARKRGE
jgi:hypothetical protein